MMPAEENKKQNIVGSAWPVRLSYNPYFLAYFFSWNNIFLSQQINE
jgi:hypothetical protein